MTYPGRGRADYLALGDWNSVCYQCGRKRKASTMLRHWQGYYVCPEHWEPREAQDFVRSVPDVQTPPWVQPMPRDVFAARCTPNGTTAYPGLATPGCVMPGYISPMYDPAVTT
jgi:hypothetical protein